MIDKSLNESFGCQEYCKPMFKTCMEKEKDEARCENKHKECISFCKFA